MINVFLFPFTEYLMKKLKINNSSNTPKTEYSACIVHLCYNNTAPYVKINIRLKPGLQHKIKGP